MKTEAIKNEDGYHVTFTGKLDLLKTNYLRKIFLSEFKNQKICLDLKKLSFVGSNGILHFFSTIDEVAPLGSIQFNVIGLSEDFKKIVKSFNYPNLTFDFVSILPALERETAPCESVSESIEDDWLDTNPNFQKPDTSSEI